MTRRDSAWLLLVLAACYNPTFTSGQFQCDLDGAVCPGDFVCVHGVCVNPATVDLAMSLPPDLAMSVPPDLAMKPPADMAVKPPADMAVKPPADMAVKPPDLAGQCVPITPNGTDVLACPGTFNNMPGGMMAAMLCPAMYHVCAGGDGSKLGDISMSTCDGLDGFFAAGIQASIHTSDNTLHCDNSGNMNNILIGCGAGATKVSSSKIDNSCNGVNLDEILTCGADGFTCTMSFMDAAHSGSTGGVLCCHS